MNPSSLNAKKEKPHGAAPIVCVAYKTYSVSSFHVSKSAMDIDGLGKSIVERFYELGWIRTMADVYRLDYDQVAQLEGFGAKSADNLKAAIDKAKQNPIYRLLHSLSIHHLGKKVSKLLAAEINHVLDLKDWTIEHFTNIHEVGPKVGENVIAYFSDPRNIRPIGRNGNSGRKSFSNRS
jgi:DNA ligase (NAD+)